MKSKLILIFLFGLFVLFLPGVAKAYCSVEPADVINFNECGFERYHAVTRNRQTGELGIGIWDVTGSGYTATEYCAKGLGSSYRSVGDRKFYDPSGEANDGEFCAALDGKETGPYTCDWQWTADNDFKVKGVWAKNASRCITCNGRFEDRILGNTSELFANSGNPTGTAGTGVCRSACGADAACDGKNPGDSCGTGKECNNSCQCVTGCTRAAPTVTATNSPQIGNPGDAKVFTFNIKSNDSAECTASTFNITNPTCPSGWTCTLNKTSVIISPGATDSSVTLTVTSPTTATAGDYTVSVRATNSQGGYSGSGNAIYRICVRNDPDISITPTTRQGAPGETRSYTVTVKSNDSSTCNARTYYYSIDNCPSGWTCSRSPTSRSLSPGESYNIAVDITPSTSALADLYSMYFDVGSTAGSYDLGYVIFYYEVVVPDFDFSISLSPSSETVTRPTSGSITRDTTASLTLNSGTTQSVTLSALNLPTGVTVSYPNTSSCPPNCSRVVRFSIASNATLGTHYITVRGTASGGLIKDATYTLTITSGFNFSISINPTSGSTNQGGSVSATVSTTLVSGTTEPVTFSASNLPSGTSASFNPLSCSPYCNSTMTINTSVSTPASTYSINVCGTGGGITQCVIYGLTVTEAGEAINAPQVTTDGANNITKTSARLNGNLTNMGNAASVLVWFEWGPTTAMGNTTAVQTRTSVGVFSADISGLTANTTYYFRAFAKNGGSW